MNYGLYVSASGALTNMARQDVYSNNLANVTTAGFKPDMFSIRTRQAVRQEDNLAMLDSNAMLERLGGGVMPLPTRIDQTPSALEVTGGPLDLGIEGEGFFAVRMGDSDDPIRLTRDGRLTLNASGMLVRATDGAPVLDTGDGEIQLNRDAAVNIASDGTVRQNGAAVAKIGLWSVPNAGAMVREGNGLFRTHGPVSESRTAGTGSIKQGAVEMSGVNPISALMQVTSASRAVQGNLRMISYFDNTMGMAISQLGRVT
ncbi:MAG: flagellar hook-basal body protein [Phycisphaeraceae bacterium]|nr:flagellar hook-basal body protein [Phycisphaerales bacterium]MCB9843070.1 flagellar hook-basal body protein [Phycisphaeraceae bacterium]